MFENESARRCYEIALYHQKKAKEQGDDIAYQSAKTFFRCAQLHATGEIYRLSPREKKELLQKLTPESVRVGFNIINYLERKEQKREAGLN